MKKSVHSPQQIMLQSMLRDARLAAGLTQYGLADKLGRPQSFVSKYEGGDRLLDVIELLTVLRAIGVTPADFIARLADEADH
ncbi:helix-turn-helix transcriptional regulator [Asticcacaulis sp. DXS10W]|uniref:Helix-turn-helix transcriptional regulator n=1 Tax=Asticcacaulis currens TaxID=2984210 RepID=A0ABT5IDL3_9CAUL|nr:helix-turn-helix transcriptional regulator [Asticcacaulis currens]MDC7694282.1 helix-turn-helix transcriptional regulator [Asticcacaulis currens]